MLNQSMIRTINWSRSPGKCAQTIWAWQQSRAINSPSFLARLGKAQTCKKKVCNHFRSRNLSTKTMNWPGTAQNMVNCLIHGFLAIAYYKTWSHVYMHHTQSCFLCLADWLQRCLLCFMQIKVAANLRNIIAWRVQQLASQLTYVKRTQE